jgi:transposase-like protein
MDIQVQSRRDKRAAKKFFRKLLKGLRYVTRVIVTDKLRSYSAAKAELLLEHCWQKYQNNRVRECASANEIARAGNEAVQVCRPGRAFSLRLRDH